MERIGLNDGGWHLAWYPGLEWRIRNDHSNERLLGFIPARVPGTVQDDLMDAGIIPDVYRDMNSMLSEWTSGRNWLYKRFLDFDREIAGKRIRIRFEGVDYYASYFLNGVMLGSSANMFAPVEFDITPHVRAPGRNVLAVAIDEPPREQCQIGRTSLVRTVKARFSYWWDFATRLIPAGIWDGVELIVDDGISIDDDLLVRVDVDAGAAALVTAEGGVRLDGSIRPGGSVGIVCEALLELRGRLLERKTVDISLVPGRTDFSLPFAVRSPELWQPNGCGDQPLYDLTLVLFEGSSETCRTTVRFGIRTVVRTVNPGFSPDARYRFEVNGRPVFIRGWNWVPVDMLYGREKRETYERLIALAKAAHVNLLRVWGGGLIEKELFYRLCDEAGIMVWQEFNQSSSGVDNEPPSDPAFITMFREYAVVAVKKRRNHACLVVWCGGNELMDGNGIPLDEERSPILRELSGIVETFGNGRDFIPTSALGPHAGLNAETLAGGGELRDVHGPWLYQGLREQYRLFNGNRCAFHAEFGVEGAVPFRLLRTFLSEDKMWPPTRENRAWNHHGSWFIDYEPLEKAFGGIDDIGEYCRLGHYLQAEALRYAVESNRRRAPSCGGTLPWQFNEPFPNAVGTSSVAYGGIPKMAYYYVKKAYAPVHASLRYGGQTFETTLRFEVWLNASIVLRNPVRVYVGIWSMSGNLLIERSFAVQQPEPEAGMQLGTVELPCDEECAIVRVRAGIDGDRGRHDGARGEQDGSFLEEPNEYLFFRGNDLSFLRKPPAAAIAVIRGEESVRIENGSGIAALFVRSGFELPDEYVCLLPGERLERKIGAGVFQDALGPDWFNR